MNVPMVDLAWQYNQLKDTIDKNVSDVLSSGNFILGHKVKLFEELFSAWHGTERSFGVASGSDALVIALQACGVGPGTEVVTVSNTFVATAHAASRLGAKVKFVDIDPFDYEMNVRDLEKAVTYDTKAIIPVHLYGHPCELDPLLDFARSHKIRVIEDCAQAMGAEYKGRKVGTIGDVGCFSFFPTKTLGGAGDGGAVTTNDPDLAECMSSLRRHGFTKKNDASLVGLNSRLDELQAAVLLPKLTVLDKWNDMRRELAQVYNECFNKHLKHIFAPIERPWAKHVYHLYVIQVEKREQLMAYLKEHGIQSQIHYETPVHQQPYYRKDSKKLHATELVAPKILSLPLYPGMTEDQARYVAETVIQFYR